MRSFLSVSAALLFALPASAQLVTGTISDNNVFYSTTSFPTTTVSTAGLGNFRATGAAGTDHLYQATWYYRILGDAQEYAFNSGAAQGALGTVNSGNRLQYTWANADNRGIAAERDIRVFSSGATSGFAVEKMTVTNNTGSPIALNLYAYCDFDQCGATSNTATANPTPDRVQVVATTCAGVTNVFAPGSDNYEVGAFATIRTKMINVAVDDLLNTGLPFGPGDFTGAWQWKDRAVAAGASFTAYFIFSIDAVHSGCTNPAGSSTYGGGKAGTNGVPTFDTSVLPFLGSVANLRITSGFGGASPFLILGAGPANIPFPPFGTILVNLGGAAMFSGVPFDGSNVSVTPIPIPNGINLCSANISIQAFIGDPGATGFVSHTGGMTWTLGGVH